jgi:hypothetical protein
MKKSLALVSCAAIAAAVIGACAEGPEENVAGTEQAATTSQVTSGSVTATLSTNSDWGYQFSGPSC